MKSKLNIFLALLIAAVFGAMLGASGSYRLSQEDAKKLKQSIARHEQLIDSLKGVHVELLHKLTTAHDTTIIETIKYETIKPKSNSVPYLDSMFRARYDK